jgi:hypothetical protein
VIGSAVILLALSIAQLVIGAIVYDFTNNRRTQIGAFYVGIFGIVCSVLGMLVNKHASFAGAYPVMCVLTATVAFIGTLVDGIAYGVIGYFKACGNSQGEMWGDSKFYEEVLTKCDLPSETSTQDCNCVISLQSMCYSYEGNGPHTFDENNCAPLMNDYPVRLTDA